MHLNREQQSRYLADLGTELLGCKPVLCYPSGLPLAPELLACSMAAAASSTPTKALPPLRVAITGGAGQIAYS